MRWYIRFAWVLLIASLLGWPATQFSLARDEPPFVLALSWLALIMTSLDIVITAHVKDDTEDQQ